MGWPIGTKSSGILIIRQYGIDTPPGLLVMLPEPKSVQVTFHKIMEGDKSIFFLSSGLFDLLIATYKCGWVYNIMGFGGNLKASLSQPWDFPPVGKYT